MKELSWDEYYFGICEAVSKRTKCLSRQIGAIIVNDKSIVSTGYNGPPRGVPPCNERIDHDLFLQEKYEKRLMKLHTDSIEKGIINKKCKIEFGSRKYFIDDDIDLNEICPRQFLGFKSGQGLEWCVAGHAERNTLINASRHGIEVKGCIMYMNCGIPCSPCLVEIINAGISEIVVTKMEYYDVSANYLVENSGLKVRKYNFM